MWIKRARFRNFGPHKELEIDFIQGLVGIFGPNGRGKTHVTNGIYAALTNDFGRFPGVKKDCIRATADVKEESSIFVVADHNGTEFQLYRGLRPDKHWLTVAGGERITKVPDIQRELESRLGINNKLIGSYVFVNQGKMYDFLSQTPGVRAATYQMLCGTEKASVICDAIEELLKSDTTLSAAVEDTTPLITQQLAEIQASITAVQCEREEAAKGIMPDAKVIRADEIQQQWKSYNRITGELALLLDEIKRVEEAAGVAETKLASKQKLVSEAVELEKTLKAQADAARATLAAKRGVVLQRAERDRQAQARLSDRRRKNLRWEELSQQLANKHAQLISQVETLVEAGKASKKPLLHDKDAQSKLLHDEVVTKRYRLKFDEQVLATFAKKGVVACPTCGTPVTRLDAHLKAIAAEREMLAAEVKHLDETIADIENARLTMIKWDEAAKQRNSQIANLKEQIESTTEARNALASDIQVETEAWEHEDAETANLPAIEEIPGDYGQLEDAIYDHDNHLGVMDAVRRLQEDARGESLRCTTKLATLKERKQNLLDDQAASKVAEDLVAKAARALERHHAARLVVAGLDSKLGVLQAQFNTQQQELTRVKTLLARQRKTRAFVSRLERIKNEVMHCQALPQWVAQANLEDMEADINQGLNLFGSPFWVEATDDLSFTVHFPGEPPRAAERLSCGQMGVLAMAFRPAMQLLFDAELGILVLDEPTAGMDATNVGFMVDALTHYAARIRGARQVILITHADGLRPAFDQVVDLGAI